MDAIVTAGGVPQPGEPLYEATQGQPKALVDVAGKPMIQWVLDALNDARHVDHIVLVGLDAEAPITSEKPVTFMPSQGHMVDNILAGADRILQRDASTEYALIVSSDIPAITGEMVDWLAQQVLAAQVDACYTIIQKHVMEARFPGSRRSYTHLKDMTVCGGDINAFRLSLAHSNTEFWDKVIESRKNVFKQAALVGYDTLLLLLLRQLSLDAAIRRVCNRLNLTGKALVSPYAEMGMDVDKPFQLEILRAD
ncbi:MAG: hypothetical protein D6755_01360, partial [Anaerolineae bacterium]